MTEFGVFARVFPAGPSTAVAAAIRRAGFTATQLNLSAIGRPTLDASLTDRDAASIASAFSHAGVRIWAVSATFNAIHPDPAVRRAGIAGALAMIARAPALGAEVVTLCTGTRNAADMWRAHPANTGPEAWAELLTTLHPLAERAATAGVRLGIEPEPGNVVQDATAAVALFEEFGPEVLAVVLDPANLLTPATLDRQDEILTDAFAQLGPWTAALHAKDVVSAGYAAPGAGGMDYDLVARLYRTLPTAVPVIAQDLEPSDALRVHAFLTGVWG